ncbi:hypothetical protein DL768_007066 [Monosporascus sp. mg162]|nr:hypothetical protein DL768_007066 [Monosporascus sp. mg162]
MLVSKRKRMRRSELHLLKPLGEYSQLNDGKASRAAFQTPHPRPHPRRRSAASSAHNSPRDLGLNAPDLPIVARPVRCVLPSRPILPSGTSIRSTTVDYLISTYYRHRRPAEIMSLSDSFAIPDISGSDHDEIDSLPSSTSESFSSDEDYDEAQREWETSIQQLELLLTMVLVPFVGKYFGRKFAYWSMDPMGFDARTRI